MSVPILDEEYMQRRAQLRYMNASVQALRGMMGPLSPPPAPDPLAEARESYATGKISFGEFSARVDVALRSRP